MRGWLAALAFALVPLQGLAQDWSFIEPFIKQTLDIRPDEGGPILFADNPDPLSATVGLAFHYYENRNGGNAMHLSIGLYRRSDAGWVYAGPVSGLFGSSPRDAVFLPGRIEITTTTLGPNEPRCCPTQVSRWAVDVTTRQTRRLN